MVTLKRTHSMVILILAPSLGRGMALARCTFARVVAVGVEDMVTARALTLLEELAMGTITSNSGNNNVAPRPSDVDP